MCFKKNPNKYKIDHYILDLIIVTMENVELKSHSGPKSEFPHPWLENKEATDSTHFQ